MIIFNTVLNRILKSFFARERPGYLRLVNASGYSFPSGHAMASILFYGIIIYFVWKSNLNKKIKVIMTIINVFLILCVGLSRVYLGVHYPSDVLGGYLLSLFVLFFGIFFFESMKKTRQC